MTLLCGNACKVDRASTSDQRIMQTFGVGANPQRLPSLSPKVFANPGCYTSNWPLLLVANSRKPDCPEAVKVHRPYCHGYGLQYLEMYLGAPKPPD